MNPQNHLARFMPPGFRAAIFFARFIYGDSRRTKQKRDYRLSILKSELLQIWQAYGAKSRTGQMNKHFLDVGLHHVGDAKIFCCFPHARDNGHFIFVILFSTMKISPLPRFIICHAYDIPVPAFFRARVTYESSKWPGSPKILRWSVVIALQSFLLHFLFFSLTINEHFIFYQIHGVGSFMATTNHLVYTYLSEFVPSTDLRENEIMQHSDSDRLTFVLAPPVGEGFVWPSGTEKRMHGLSRPVYRLQVKKKRQN